MIRRPPRSTLDRSSAASDVYKRQDAPGAGAAVILQADNQAVLDAVSEAKGVVDGFITPEQAYQATMELNIQGVIDGTDEATRLIQGVPARKLITIEWAQSGTDVVAALRAMGLIQ